MQVVVGGCLAGDGGRGDGGGGAAASFLPLFGGQRWCLPLCSDCLETAKRHVGSCGFDCPRVSEGNQAVKLASSHSLFSDPS